MRIDGKELYDYFLNTDSLNERILTDIGRVSGCSQLSIWFAFASGILPSFIRSLFDIAWVISLILTSLIFYVISFLFSLKFLKHARECNVFKMKWYPYVHIIIVLILTLIAILTVVITVRLGLRNENYMNLKLDFTYLICLYVPLFSANSFFYFNAVLVGLYKYVDKAKDPFFR